MAAFNERAKAEQVAPLQAVDNNTSDGELVWIGRAPPSWLRDECATNHLRCGATSMSDTFDPLHRWLGIPPEEQPPNHYRLLGLKAFEANADVIDAAADQRMSYVRQSSMGKYAEFSQPVLNALSAARVCLLEPQAKEAYDAALRKKLKSKRPLAKAVPLEAAATPVAVASAPKAPTATEPLGFNPDPLGLANNSIAVKPPSKSVGRQSLSPLVLMGLAGGALVLLLLAGLFVMVMNSTSPTDSSELAHEDSATGLDVPPLVEHSPLPPPEQQVNVPAKLPPVGPIPVEPEKPLPQVEQPVPPPIQTVASETNRLAVPLIIPNPQKSAFLILGDNSEFKTAQEACARYELKAQRGGLNTSQDYSAYHTLITGSNAVDFYGTAERRKPEAFDNIEKFVKEGGHLVVFGSYNGRNMHHMTRFGIHTGFQHCGGFLRVPEHSDVLFQGMEDVVPDNSHLRSAGSFWVKTPHIVLLRRNDQGEKSGPALVTIPYYQGRVTFTECEPQWLGDHWLITVLIAWIARGAPVYADDQPGDALLAKVEPGDVVSSPAPLPQANPQPGPRRLALPSPEESQRSLALVKEIFGDQIDKAKSPAEKSALAQTLFKHASDASNDATAQYVLLQEAYSQAMGAKDVPAVLAILSLLGERYEVDATQLKVEAVTKLGREQRDPAGAQQLVAVCLDQIADMVDADQFNEAAKLSGFATSLARRSQHRHFIGLATYVEKQVKNQARAFEQITEDLALLRATPLDPAANLAVGRFYALIKGDWKRGLEYLSRGGDAPLAQLAREEAKGMRIGDEAAKLGSDWLAVASELSAEEQVVAQRQARRWFRMALPNLKGLKRAEVEAKLAKLPSTPFQLHFIVREVHGKEEVHLRPEVTQWKHLTWSHPSSVVVNEVQWDIRGRATLPNRGSTQLLPPDLDFSKATLKKVKGRGSVVLVPHETHVVVHIDDGPDMSDHYEFLVMFPE